MRSAIVAAVVLALSATALDAESLRVIAFNVESGGADPDTIAEQMLELGPADIWGFSEVERFWWALKFKEVATTMTGDPYYFDFGTTGGGDRLVLLYNTAKLEKVGDHVELHDINPENRVRSPLVTRLRVKSTGVELLAMVNHLYRGRADKRHQQARQLNEWGRDQGATPVIAMGDYNFDWVSDVDRDQGFDNMTRDDVFRWVRPDPTLPSQCHPDYQSILDFVFVGGEARNWTAQSDILFPDASYCTQSNLRSDHRPVEAIFELPATGVEPEVDPTAIALAELRESVAALEAAIATVRAKLEALEAAPR